MIISQKLTSNHQQEFSSLMATVDTNLNSYDDNEIKSIRELSPEGIERFVCEKLNRCSRGTVFSGGFEQKSGHYFPDIIAREGYYGVEVKSTKSDNWITTGSSINESTRCDGIERIYLTFAKLGGKVQFLSRPYESCLSEIAVTHYPRYRVDMTLKQGETIFDKMGVSYEKLRRMSNPIPTVAEYYREQLQEGQTLWWASGNEEQPVSPIIQSWDVLSADEKKSLRIQGYAYFPELVTDGPDYANFGFWLLKRKNVVNFHLRDLFSAGGRETVVVNGRKYPVSASMKRVYDNWNDIVRCVNSASEHELMECWDVFHVERDRISQWLQLVDDNSKYSNCTRILRDAFKTDTSMYPQRIVDESVKTVRNVSIDEAVAMGIKVADECGGYESFRTSDQENEEDYDNDLSVSSSYSVRCGFFDNNFSSSGHYPKTSYDDKSSFRQLPLLDDRFMLPCNSNKE